MTHDDIHKRIQQAATHAAPDQLDAILSACEKQKGTVITMTNHQKNRWLAPLSAVAALAIIAGSVFGVSRFQQASADSVVTLDINPSIALSIDPKERVQKAVALNQDAQVILGEMELEGTNLETAVYALIGACLQKGYLDELQNAILVSVETEDTNKAQQLQNQLTTTISGAFNPGAILTQTLAVNDELIQLASQYNISAGKANLIQEVVAQDSTLTFESLAPLSMSEISLIASSRNLSTTGVSKTGSISDQAYIGQDAALNAACQHAGITATTVQGLSTEFGWENGRMVYELDFCSNGTEYEYDIDAMDGGVSKQKTEPCDHTWHNSPSTEGSSNTGSSNTGSSNTGSSNTGSSNTGSSNTGSSNTGSSNTGTATSLIGETAATNAALSHANVSKSAAQSLTVKLDYDDGIACYEIEFCSAGVEYDYEVNASSGAIVKYEHDTCDHYAHHTTSTGNSNTGNSNTGGSTTGFIGYDAALQKALAHAGLSASQISRLENELDRDDGVYRYEISFHVGNMEYDYEIHATSGQVLKYESERDD